MSSARRDHVCPVHVGPRTQEEGATTAEFTLRERRASRGPATPVGTAIGHWDAFLTGRGGRMGSGCRAKHVQTTPGHQMGDHGMVGTEGTSGPKLETTPICPSLRE